MIMDLTYGLGEEIYGMSEESASIVPRDDVHILVTEADKTGQDILAMSEAQKRLDKAADMVEKLRKII